MVLASWLGFARAAEPLPPLVPDRPVSLWEARLGALGGLAGDDTGTFAMAEVPHFLGAGGTATGAAWDAGLGGTFRYGDSWGANYNERAHAGVTLPGGGGVVGSFAAGGSPGWSETGMQGRWGRRFQAAAVELRSGLAMRGEDARTTTGLSLEAEASVRLSARASAGAWINGRNWWTIHAPGLTFQGGGYVTGAPSVDSRLTLATGARGGTQTDDAYAEWAGLPAPGEVEGWAAGRAHWLPPGPVALVVEAGGVLGVADGSREGWIAAGVELRHGGMRAAPARAAPVTFRLLAPGARDVRVAGSFNGWVAEPLTPGADGTWTLQKAVDRGQHEYVYLVDGKAVVPPEARRRVSDGLGGENGVFEGPG